MAISIKGIGTAFFAAAISFSGSAFAEPLKVAHSTWVGYGPFYIALEKGFY